MRCTTFRLPRTHLKVNPIASTRDGGATAPATTAAAPAWAPGSRKGGGGCFRRDCVRRSLGKCSLSTAPWVLCFPLNE